MSVLGELRAMVAWKFDNGTPNNGDMQKTIVDFETKHPGLVDRTDRCHYCGRPMKPGLPPHGRTCPACAKEAK